MDNEYHLLFYIHAKMLGQSRTYKKAIYSLYFHLSDYFLCHPIKFFIHPCTFISKCTQDYDSLYRILHVQKLDIYLKLAEWNRGTIN